MKRFKKNKDNGGTEIVTIYVITKDKYFEDYGFNPYTIQIAYPDKNVKGITKERFASLDDAQSYLKNIIGKETETQYDNQ